MTASQTRQRFVCDHMLGTLAKWLRLLGYDTLYPGPIDDRDLAARAYDEGRTLLTRDKNLAARVKGAFFVASDDIDEQLKAVVSSQRLSLSNSLSLCSVCNTAIVEVGREEVKDIVPPAVYGIQKEFWRCPSCSRVYWRGSHWDDMLRRIRKLEAGTGESQHLHKG